MSGTGAVAEPPLGWNEQALRRAYSQFLRSKHPIGKALDVDQWVRVNELLDEGLMPDDVANRVRSRTELLALVSGARRCLERYENDPPRLKRCLNGEP